MLLLKVLSFAWCLFALPPSAKKSILEVNQFGQSLLSLTSENPITIQFLADAKRNKLVPNASDFSAFFIGIHVFDGCFVNLKDEQIAEVKDQLQQVAVVIYQFYLISRGNFNSPLTKSMMPTTWSICDRNILESSAEFEVETRKLMIKFRPGNVVSSKTIMNQWRTMAVFPTATKKYLSTVWPIINPFGAVIPILRDRLYTHLDNLDVSVSPLEKEKLFSKIITETIYLSSNCQVRKDIQEKKLLFGFVNVENRHNIEICVSAESTIETNINRDIKMIGFVNVSTSDDVTVIATEILQIIGRIIDNITTASIIKK